MSKNQIWILSGTLVVLCICVMVGGIAAYVAFGRQVEGPNPDIAANFPSVDAGDTNPEEALETIKLADSSSEVKDPLIAIDGAGVLHLVYREPRNDAPYKTFFHRQMTPDGNWSAAQAMSAEVDELDWVSWLLRNPAGQICVFGSGNISNSYSLFMSCLENGQWSELREVGEGKGLPAFTPDGVVKTVHQSPTNNGVYFGDVDLSDDEANAYPLNAFIIDQSGGYHVVWTRQGDPFSMEYRYSNDGGQTWSAQERLSDGQANVLSGVDEQGNVYLLIGDSIYGRWAGNGWELEKNCKCLAHSEDMAVDVNGGVHLVAAGREGIHYAQRSIDGRWSEPYLITDMPSNGVKIAVDQQGRRHFVWTSEGGLYYGLLP